MAWSSPRTWITGEVISAAELNSQVRDNLTALQPQGSTIATQETTTSLTSADLTTVGPAVALVTGTSAVCSISSFAANNVNGDGALISIAVSGATTIAAPAGASNTQMLVAAVSQQVPLSNTFILSGLTAGSNTFTMKYAAVLGGTAVFANRTIVVTAPY